MSDPTHVLFVCSGNICRSPMAEGMARTYARQRGRDMEVRSAGTLMIEGAPADPKAVKVCREIDVDLSEHRSQGVTEDLLQWADWVLVMEFKHAAALRDRFDDPGEVMMLGHLGGAMEITDPIGGWTFQFRRNRDLIKKCVEAFVDRLPASGD